MNITIPRVLTLAASVALLAGCAVGPNGPIGPHLVYRDPSGVAIRQFDYPDYAFCRRVEVVAGPTAHCQPEPASNLPARATLRYDPPGVTVEAHYIDMARCRTDTGALASGVALIRGCAE